MLYGNYVHLMWMRYLSYLPFAHIFERVIVLSLLHFGGAAGFFHGDTLGLMDDLKALNPTVFCGVPRIFERYVVVFICSRKP